MSVNCCFSARDICIFIVRMLLSKNYLHKFLHLKISITFAFPKNEVVSLLGTEFFTGLNFNKMPV